MNDMNERISYKRTVDEEAVCGVLGPALVLDERPLTSFHATVKIIQYMIAASI